MTRERRKVPAAQTPAIPKTPAPAQAFDDYVAQNARKVNLGRVEPDQNNQLEQAVEFHYLSPRAHESKDFAEAVADPDGLEGARGIEATSSFLFPLLCDAKGVRKFQTEQEFQESGLGALESLVVAAGMVGAIVNQGEDAKKKQTKRK